MKIIVGLGNPGKSYENTFHNAGFLTVDLLAKSLGVSFTLKPKLLAMVAETKIGGEKVVIAKPQTFMNNSGESVRAIIDFFKADHSELLVIYDDIDIEIGAIRLRESGSAGTHNGMRSILSHLQLGDFKRVRIGIKPINKEIPLIDYVLMNIPKEQRTQLDKAFESASLLAKGFIMGESVQNLMCAYNGKKQQ